MINFYPFNKHRPFIKPYLLAIAVLALQHVAQAQLRLTNGTSLVTNNNTYITLTNMGLNNSGIINAANSYLVFTGTASAASTLVSSASSLGNITINKAAGGVALGTNLSVTNTVQLTSGTIDLNGFDLNLGTTGTLSGESATSYITSTTGGGALISTATLNSPSAVSPGNIGIAITSSANFGTTTIRRVHQVQTITSTASSIRRYYDVQPTNNSGLNATVRFSYLDNELNGLSESGLGFYSSVDGGTTWVKLGATTFSTTTNYVEKNFILFNTRLTLADNSATLPISLLNFTGMLTTAGTELQWVTVSEHNNRQFGVERSKDGISFTRFAVVLSQGNSSARQTYHLTDTVPFSGIQYYRLKQLNTDGSFTYSKIIAVNKGKFLNKIVSVFPVPAKTNLHINLTSESAAKLVPQISNNKGQVVASRQMEAVNGLNNLTLDVSQLSTGVYYVSCFAFGAAPIRFVKAD